jgi:hypothetical protein
MEDFNGEEADLSMTAEEVGDINLKLVFGSNGDDDDEAAGGVAAGGVAAGGVAAGGIATDSITVPVAPSAVNVSTAITVTNANEQSQPKRRRFVALRGGESQ